MTCLVGGVRWVSLIFYFPHVVAIPHIAVPSDSVLLYCICPLVHSSDAIVELVLANRYSLWKPIEIRGVKTLLEATPQQNLPTKHSAGSTD